MAEGKPNLKLIEDPVAATLWLLRRMPLEVAASYLAVVAACANAHGILSPEDQTRLRKLLDDILSDGTVRAA